MDFALCDVTFSCFKLCSQSSLISESAQIRCHGGSILYNKMNANNIFTSLSLKKNKRYVTHKSVTRAGFSMLFLTVFASFSGQIVII